MHGGDPQQQFWRLRICETLDIVPRRTLTITWEHAWQQRHQRRECNIPSLEEKHANRRIERALCRPIEGSLQRRKPTREGATEDGQSILFGRAATGAFLSGSKVSQDFHSHHSHHGNLTFPTIAVRPKSCPPIAPYACLSGLAVESCERAQKPEFSCYSAPREK